MRSSSSVGLGLSLVFGCLLLALIAELYYLLWCKKRVTNREIEQSYSSESSVFYMFCWKKPSSLTSTGLATETQVYEPQVSSSSSSSLSSSWVRPIMGQECDEMSVETELLRLPRFLFTIKEETKEDLESEDKSKRGSRGRSLSDVVFSVETPFYTPIASPPYFTPPITPLRDSTYRAFSPLNNASSDAEFSRVWSSPPPKFKFLRDAEDKLQKRILVERFGVDASIKKSDENGDGNGSFITLNISSQCHSSSSSQVLPLAASPPTFSHKFYKNPNS